MNLVKDLTCHLVKTIDPQGRRNYLHNPFSKQNIRSLSNKYEARAYEAINSLLLMMSWYGEETDHYNLISFVKNKNKNIIEAPMKDLSTCSLQMILLTSMSLTACTQSKQRH